MSQGEIEPIALLHLFPSPLHAKPEHNSSSFAVQEDMQVVISTSIADDCLSDKQAMLILLL
jgi:hypothetical protein